MWLLADPRGTHAQVKASYKLSEEFKKGPAKPKKVAKVSMSPGCPSLFLDVTSQRDTCPQRDRSTCELRAGQESSNTMFWKASGASFCNARHR